MFSEKWSIWNKILKDVNLILKDFTKCRVCFLLLMKLQNNVEKSPNACIRKSNSIKIALFHFLNNITRQPRVSRV